MRKSLLKKFNVYLVRLVRHCEGFIAGCENDYSFQYFYSIVNPILGASTASVGYSERSRNRGQQAVGGPSWAWSKDEQGKGRNAKEVNPGHPTNLSCRPGRKPKKRRIRQFPLDTNIYSYEKRCK